MASIQIPPTKVAVEKELSNPNSQYCEIVLCRGTLLLLLEQKTVSFNQLELNLPRSTGFIPTQWILRRLLTTLESCDLIKKILATQLSQHKGEIYDLAITKHRQYVKARPGFHKSNPNSIHDGIAYYFITPNGEKKAEEIKKNFPKGIAFKTEEEDGSS